MKAELNGQLRKLVYPGFLEATPWEKLQHLPRYLKGMVLRMDKYSGNPERDQRHASAIAGLWQQYEQRLEKHGKAGISDSILGEFRWQIEELCISLFAQELKTPTPISVKRLRNCREKWPLEPMPLLLDVTGSDRRSPLVIVTRRMSAGERIHTECNQSPDITFSAVACCKPCLTA